MTPVGPDYYRVLGVSRDATAEDIRRAYRRLARRYHPDVNSGIDARARFGELSDAYEVLHDPEQRARYDHSSVDAERFTRSRLDRVPAFTRERSRRDVPHFLDDETDELVLDRRGPAARWLVVFWEPDERARDPGEWPGVRWWPW